MGRILKSSQFPCFLFFLPSAVFSERLTTVPFKQHISTPPWQGVLFSKTATYLFQAYLSDDRTNFEISLACPDVAFHISHADFLWRGHSLRFHLMTLPCRCCLCIIAFVPAKPSWHGSSSATIWGFCFAFQMSSIIWQFPCSSRSCLDIHSCSSIPFLNDILYSGKCKLEALWYLFIVLLCFVGIN